MVLSYNRCRYFLGLHDSFTDFRKGNIHVFGALIYDNHHNPCYHTRVFFYLHSSIDTMVFLSYDCYTNFKRTSFNQHYTLTSTCQSRSFYLVLIPWHQYLFDIYRVLWYDLHMMSYLSLSVRHSTTVSNLYYIHILSGSYVCMACFFYTKKEAVLSASHLLIL